MTKLLAICIPTYNGGEYLKYNINKLIDMSLKYNFDICVSDNASTDDTEEYMLNLMAKYNFVKYHRNGKNMGAAYNFDYVLKMSDTKYAWLLGDDDEIFENDIKKIEYVLKEYKPNICILNSLNDKNLKEKIYTDKNEVMNDLGLALTYISNYVISKDVIKNINLKIKNNAFPHTIAILKYLEFNKCNLYFLDEITIKSIRSLSKIRYSDKVIKYFFKDYKEITEYVTNYKSMAKTNFVRKSYELFSFKFLANLRRSGAISLKNLYIFKDNLNLIPNKIKFKMFFVSLMPICFINIIYYIYKTYWQKM